MELVVGGNLIIPTVQLTLLIELFGADNSIIDCSAYLLSPHTQKVRGDDDMIFYGQLHNKNKTIYLQQHPSIQFIINLAQIDNDVEKIAICATMSPEQTTFSKINQLKLTLFNQKQIVLTANIQGQGKTEAALILAEFYRHKQNWKFRFVNQGFNGGLKPLAEHFGVDIADDSSVPQHTTKESKLKVSPFDEIRKKRNTQQAVKTLQQDLMNNKFNTHTFENFKKFCIDHSLNINEILKSCEQESHQFILQIAHHQSMELLDHFATLLQISSAYLQQAQAIAKIRYEAQFKQLITKTLEQGDFTALHQQQFDQFCTRYHLDKNKIFRQCDMAIDNFLRFTLANVIADSVVSLEEQRLMDHLCQYFNPNQAIINEINLTIERINKIAKIKRGEVHPIQTQDIIVRNSEIVYLHHDNTSLIIQRKNAKNNEIHKGDLFITSERIVFKSKSPKDINISSILAYESNKNIIYITAKTASKSCEFYIGEQVEFVEAYIEQAVKRFHRQLDLRQNSNNTRYITERVRNTVWQRCNGKCVECGATSYLEFDHIIPFSKGGSNSENNIQLLCRACNLKKSDRI